LLHAVGFGSTLPPEGASILKFEKSEKCFARVSVVRGVIRSQQNFSKIIHEILTKHRSKFLEEKKPSW
jgi:hypothetical protein